MITGSEIKEIRVMLGMTQFELSKRMYCSRSLINMVETGQRTFDQEESMRVMQVFQDYASQRWRKTSRAQKALNAIKNRSDCANIGTNTPNSSLSSGGELLK